MNSKETKPNSNSQSTQVLASASKASTSKNQNSRYIQFQQDLDAFVSNE